MIHLLSDAGADKDIADQGDASPLLVASENGRLEVVRLLSDAGPTRTSQTRMVALPCPSLLKVDTWRWSACSLMQGPAGTPQCRVVLSYCSLHLRVDTSSPSTTSKPGRFSPSPGGTALAEAFIHYPSEICFRMPRDRPVDVPLLLVQQQLTRFDMKRATRTGHSHAVGGGQPDKRHIREQKTRSNEIV